MDLRRYTRDCPERIRVCGLVWLVWSFRLLFSSEEGNQFKYPLSGESLDR